MFFYNNRKRIVVTYFLKNLANWKIKIAMVKNGDLLVIATIFFDVGWRGLISHIPPIPPPHPQKNRDKGLKYLIIMLR